MEAWDNPLATFAHLREEYENNEQVRNLCKTAGISKEAVDLAPMKGYAWMYFLHGLVWAGKDSDEDLLLLFGSLPEGLINCRSDVRASLLPSNAMTGSPQDMMNSHYRNFFKDVPFNPRPPTAEEIEQEQKKVSKLYRWMNNIRSLDEVTTSPSSSSSASPSQEATVNHLSSFSMHCKCCGLPETNQPFLKCTGCKLVFYCSTKCSHKDWSQHKQDCLKQHKTQPGKNRRKKNRNK